MNIEEVLKELKLLYFTYDDLHKLFLKRIDGEESLCEFNRIVNKLTEHDIGYKILNTKCILLKVDL